MLGRGKNCSNNDIWIWISRNTSVSASDLASVKFIEAIPLCYLLNKLHLLHWTQHRFILIVPYMYATCFGPFSGMSVQKSSKGRYKTIKCKGLSINKLFVKYMFDLYFRIFLFRFLYPLMEYYWLVTGIILEAILLCYMLNKLYLLHQTQHRFILILPYMYATCFSLFWDHQQACQYKNHLKDDTVK
jgi:hypothetical protein